MTRRSIATVCVSGTLDDKLAAAAAAGFDGIELFENDLIVSPWSPAEVRSRCADLGLSIYLYQPFRDFEATPHPAAALRRAEHKFEVMAELGADTLLVCSSVSAEAMDDDDLAAEQLAALANAAAGRGIRIAYEALAWGRHVNTWDHSWRIVRAADHPALGLCLDSFHILSRSSTLDGIEDIPPEKIFFVQLADAPHLRMDVLQWSRHHRLFPGQGSFDLSDFLGRLKNYDGPLSLEVFNDVFRQSDPERTAVDAMRSLLALEEVPAAPELRAHAFTEFGVDGRSGPELQEALRGLGFTHTGQHRSKPVELWEQGACRVILNSAVTRPRTPGTASLSAFALTSADPAQSGVRAEALLAPPLPRTRGPREAELTSVAAPDGSTILFSRDDDDWRADFLATGEIDTGGAGLTHTDHLGLAQPFDHFDEAGLFYRSVLGLTQLTTEEYAAPFGLMRSRAFATGDRTIRLALTVALLRRGDWAPAVVDPQHLAFATDDIFATAEAIGPTLPVPDNYYADLRARFALPDETVERLRRFGILYDRDATGGELLHLYTPVFGGRVFFEIVQRTGGYDAFGETNAPVRMAAHRHARLSS
ncbi:sugar phosphate isomerase/epimerase and 4-hydroxyphenylpyruvate domain-containing protein [Actinoplanes sp. NBRC 103695]|uniref:bifunctional sugar phosphate isomerase/epimerase/4-hydroxyphenylpyruvate dioxygenase family protein n=1 Tax=Actinoplanes sp. NBRC 103695 TaxID=3032202 RepID=UPI0024A35D77|nr:sugar phosphate isomerase/epimerase and 4-hydroxyphenylpyruvate domain-containing protein [Actinoplanes sp. NBRC 103695]GLY99952.1 4-hydroxyphenylpyruvate dioxygenase [Actinoplanes sp. NBRC 103695]